MADVGRFIVALEMLLLPVWVGVACVRPPRALGLRLVLAPAPVLLVAAALVVLAAVGGDGLDAGPVLRSQSVAVGFALLLAGMAAFADRLAGPRVAQFTTAVVGWAVVAGVILAGPVPEVLDGAAQAAVARVLVHGNPLVVAENELGLNWLRQDLTYRWTGLGESYSYLFGHVAWWKTLLAHVFVGSGLAVFSIRRGDGPPSGGSPDLPHSGVD